MLSIQRVLFPTDFSAGATRAFPQAVSVAAGHDAELHIVNVPESIRESVASLPVAPNVLTEWCRAEGNEDAPDLEALSIVQRRLEPGSPPERLVAYAKGHDVDLVVMGTHGRRGLRRMMLGSVTEEVLRTAPCPVLTVRAGEENEAHTDVRRILAPVDVSDASETAVEHARELTRIHDAELHLLHVVEEVNYTSAYGVESPLIAHDEIVTKVKKTLGEMARESVGEESVQVSAVVGYAPWSILDYVEENDIDLIVIATHGRSGLDRVLLGSVAERVLRRSSVPVFLVKPDQASLAPSRSTETSRSDG